MTMMKFEMPTSEKSIHRTTVQGTPYEVWGDFALRGSVAMNAVTQEMKQISGSGYISKDLTLRKAIAATFKHDSFRK
ncbi:hypothetical protein FACS1894184_21520 [Clostridia bacterium]|nr:hypothetical protein FACS1894184_21520 [Clostridia bacterium]